MSGQDLKSEYSVRGTHGHQKLQVSPRFRVEGSGNRKCKTLKKSNFLKNGKMVISVKIQKFSRSQMTKWTSPLESSHEI